MNMSGMQCYFAMEDSDTCQRMMCGAKRAFQFKIVDNLGAEVIHISRPFKCCGGCGICAFCSDCAAHEVTIESPPGTVIGYVKQAWVKWIETKLFGKKKSKNAILVEAGGGQSLIFWMRIMSVYCESKVRVVFSMDHSVVVIASSRFWRLMAQARSAEWLRNMRALPESLVQPQIISA